MSMGELNDRKLISLVRGGDSSALDLLFERHYGTVYRIAWRFCGIQQDAEDVAQEVFVKLVRKLSSFGGKSSFTTWLYRIVVNTALDFRRKSAATRFRHEDYAEHRLRHNPSPSAGGNPIDSEGIQAAIDKLPEKQKAAILLVFGEGLSHRETSRILGCPEVSVSWRIFQARKKLRVYMEHPS